MPWEIKSCLLAIIPIFVAMDAIGVLPIFISLTEGMQEDERKRVVRDSILTGFVVGLGFLILGKFIFGFIGVTIPDFKVAGGTILLIIAIHDLLFPEKKRRVAGGTVGIVPLGMPLIVGPAVLTTIIIAVDAYGYLPTITSLIINLAFAWWVFSRADLLVRFLGEGGAKGVAKVASLLLAAIAVMMIRMGIIEMIQGSI
ncbi:MAG: MarC family protein [Deltaproteobacteria bacterium]|nr:MAG: MarC family protein [Deltaproteobacteria bacterium]